MIVGRQVVLDRLEDLLEASAERGAVAQIVAEAGLGKTRTAAEVAARARARGRLVVEGRAHPMDAALPLGVIGDALRADRRARPDAPPPDDPLAADFPSRVLPELGASPDEATAERGSLFEAASRYVRALAQPGGLVLVLEDLHWADPSSHALVHYLARTTVADPVLIVVTYRPDEAAPGSSLDGLRRELARARLAEEIPLAPLDRLSVAAMLAAILGRSVDADAEEAVHRMSAGNPFVVEELIRDAVESGSLDLASGRLEKGHLELPWTVQEMLLARVRRVGEPDQELLRWAAVVGRRFDLRVLAAAAGQGEGAALAGLARLREAGLVSEDCDDALGLIFAFRHALTREAVLGELLTAERRRRHGQVLEAAEAVWGDSPDAPLDELVGHALAAGDAERGFRYSMRAAKRSNQLGGYVEARAHLERALELWHPGLGAEARANVLLSLGRLVARLTNDRRAVTLLMHAREGYLALGDTAWAAVALAAAAEARWELGDQAAAVEELRAAREELGPDAPVGARLKVLSGLSRVQMLSGDFAVAADTAAEALALVPEAPGRSEVLDRIQLLNTYGCATWHRGETGMGRSALLESLRLAREHNDDAGAVRAFVNLAVNWDTPPAEGIRYTDAGLRMARERGLRPQEAKLLTVRANLDLLAGDLESSERHLEEAQRVLDEVGSDAGSRLDLRLSAAELLLARGDAEAAAAAFAAVVPELEASGELYLEKPWARWGLAAAHLAAGQPEAAREALAALTARGNPDWPPKVHERLLEVEVAAALGDGPVAERIAAALEARAPGPRSRYARALAGVASGRLPEPGEIERAAADVAAEGRVLLSAVMLAMAAVILADAPVEGGADEAAALASAALALHREIGAPGWARRMEELLRRLGRRAPSRGAGPSREGLTAREIEVLRLLAEGVSNRGAAERLVISERTAARHVANIFAKLGVHTRAQAVRVAAERGLLGDPART
jgi:DNA-binding CsgD family transcriptional regulator